jgi:tetratricopeptide (TPR) repeat protein
MGGFFKMSYDVFISYKKLTGESYATYLKETLDKVGHNCFCADLSEKYYGEYPRKKEIDSAFESCKYFIFIITMLGDLYEVIEKYKKATDLNKEVILYRWSGIEVPETKELSTLHHQREFKDGHDLANKVINELKGGIEKNAKEKEFLDRGNLFYYVGRYEEAEEEYRKALKMDPNDPVAHNNLGYLLCNLNRYKESEKEYKEAIRIDPNDAQIHHNLGDLLDYLKCYNEAEKEYKEAIRINSNDTYAHHTLGDFLEYLERYDEAEKEYREVIRINPNDADAHTNLGTLLKHLKRYAESEKEYKEAIRLNPNLAYAHGGLGLLYKLTRKFGDAKEEILKAKELFEKQKEIGEVANCDELLKNLEGE